MVTTLELCRADHEGAVLAFELENRAFFAAAVSDRGDDYFDHFSERHRELIADQDEGRGAYYLCLDPDALVLGRFNLYFEEPGIARVGYRVAQRACGQGIASASVDALCQLAVTRHGLHTLRAATTHGNTASQRVLAKAGFRPAGPAGPEDLGGKHGTWFELALPGQLASAPTSAW